MSTHNICFRGEIRKILCGYLLLSGAMQGFDLLCVLSPLYVHVCVYPSAFWFEAGITPYVNIILVELKVSCLC